MLCLSRRAGEEITVGDGITIRVLAIRGTQVKLGLVAPLETRILRGELRELEVTHGDE